MVDSGLIGVDLLPPWAVGRCGSSFVVGLIDLVVSEFVLAIRLDRVCCLSFFFSVLLLSDVCSPFLSICCTSFVLSLNVCYHMLVNQVNM